MGIGNKQNNMTQTEQILVGWTIGTVLGTGLVLVGLWIYYKYF